MLQAFSLYVYRPMCSWAILPQAAWALQASSVRLHVQMYFNVFALILCWFVVNQYKSSRIAASEVSFGLSTWMGSTHYNNTLIAGKFPPATAAFHARMAQFPVVQELFADTGAEWISLFRQGHKKENLVTHLCMQPNPQQSCTPKQRILRFWQFCLIVNLWWFVDLFS